MQIIQLHNNKQLTRIVLGNTGEVIVSQDYGSFADLPKIEKQNDVVLLIPGEDVLVTRINIPKTNRSALESAVPFALEERLAEDVEKLHFSIGDFDQNGQLLVAVIKKSVLQSYIKPLLERGIFPRLVLPDFLALRFVENNWTTVLENDRVLLRSGQSAGFSIEAAVFADCLANIVSQTDVPETIYYYHDTDNAPQFPFPEQSNVIENVSSFSKNIAIDQLQQNNAINLLPRQYRYKKSKPAVTKHWYFVGIAALFWLLVLFGGKIAEVIVLKHRLNQIQHQITQTQQQLSVNAQQQSFSKFQINQMLNAYRQSVNGNTFLFLLAKTGDMLKQHPNIELSRIHYANHTLKIDVTAPSMDVLDTFLHQLSQLGFSVRQDQLESGHKQISAEYQIGQ